MLLVSSSGCKCALLNITVFFSLTGKNTSTGPDGGEHSSGAPAQPSGMIPTRTEQGLLEKHCHSMTMYLFVTSNYKRQQYEYIMMNDCTEVQKAQCDHPFTTTCVLCQLRQISALYEFLQKFLFRFCSCHLIS